MLDMLRANRWRIFVAAFCAVAELAGHLQQFPWLPLWAQHYVELGAFLGTAFFLALINPSARPTSPNVGDSTLNKIAKSVPVVVLGAIVLTLQPACAHPRHVAVVADTALYEVLNDVHQVEQRALTDGLVGWTLEKSRAFNRTLLPAVEGGRQLNQVLAAWKPGQPIPDRIKQLVLSLGHALAAVTKDFPDGETKSAILANLGKAQQIILNALQIVLDVKGGD